MSALAQSAWTPPAADAAAGQAWTPPLADKAAGAGAPQGVAGHIENFAKNFWGQFVGAGEAMLHPIKAAESILPAQGALIQKGVDAMKRGDYVEAARHAIDYMIPGVGPSIDKAGDQAQSGDVSGGLGSAAGIAALTAAPGAMEAHAGGIAAGLETAGKLPRAVAAGAKAAGPDVATGGAAIAGGELLAHVPGMEWPARIGLGYPGARQV